MTRIIQKQMQKTNYSYNMANLSFYDTKLFHHFKNLAKSNVSHKENINHNNKMTKNIE